MKISQQLQSNIVGWIQGNAFPAAPTGLHLVLSSSDPLVGITEVGTRQPITLVSKDNSLVNASLIVVPNAGGNITHVAIADAVSGDVLLSSPIDVPRVLAGGDNLPIAPNEVVVSFSDLFYTGMSTILYAWLNGTDAPAPTQMYMEISRGASFNPPRASDDYHPQELTTVTPAVYIAGIGTTLENSDNVLFPDAKTNAWGAITHLFITNGDKEQYLRVELSTNKTVQLGESVGFANNAVQFTIG